MKLKYITILIAAALFIVAIKLLPEMNQNRSSSIGATDTSASNKSSSSNTNIIATQGITTNKPSNKTLPNEASEDEIEARFFYGTTSPVKPSSSAQAQSVYEALKEKKYPERLGWQFSKEFNYKSFRSNPQKYIDTIEPGRVFRPAQPGENVPRITRSSPLRRQVKHGEFVTLKVEIDSKQTGLPVTFTSFDLGRFENDLTSINVVTDSSGIAKVKFYGAEGTINAVNILAASPLSSGRVKFVVDVLRADGTRLGELPKSHKK